MLLFFARFVVWMDTFLPRQSRLSLKVSRYFRSMFDYYDCKKRVIAWHRAELERMDADYCIQQASLRLIVAREKAQAEGIGPLDSRYPVMHDFDSVALQLREMKEERLAAHGIFLKK